MFGRNLLPSLWHQSDVPSRREENHHFFGIQRDMNRLFDDFFRGLDVAPPNTAGERLGRFVPSLDVRENDKEVHIQVELPGMDEKDVEVLLTDNSLTLKGEKKEDREDKGKDFYHVERSYGSFQRVITLPEGIDTKKAEAKFKKGILSISLPKVELPKAKAKKIEIKTA
ncbi:MAG: Hsp20/alpha crystallin family protein [Syntrophales bacterium]